MRTAPDTHIQRPWLLRRLQAGKTGTPNSIAYGTAVPAIFDVWAGAYDVTEYAVPQPACVPAAIGGELRGSAAVGRYKHDRLRLDIRQPYRTRQGDTDIFSAYQRRTDVN